MRHSIRRGLVVVSVLLVAVSAPALRCLDDLVIVPLGILLAVKAMPAGLMQEFRTAATSAGG